MDPISGQRFFQAWQADTVLPYARDFYARVESKCQAIFFHVKPSIRFFQSEDERNLWEDKHSLPKVRDYFPSPPRPYFSEQIKAPYEGVEVVGSGHLDTQTFLSKSRHYFSTHHSVITSTFTHSDLTQFDDHIEWQGISARFIIFCEGWMASYNPWFSWLPFNHSKGNILTLGIQKIPTSHILHLGKWALPLTEDRLKFGATYDKNFRDELPDSSAKEDLLTYAQAWFKSPLTVLDHQAAIRPISLDNKPIIGAHPTHPRLLILNTLGSRGVSLAPYYSHQLLSSIFGQAPLDADVRLTRYHRYYRM